MCATRKSEAASRLPCICCGSAQTDSRTEVESTHTGESYTLYECRSCGSAFYDLNQHQVDLATLYDEQSSDNAAIYRPEFTPNRYWAREVRRLQRLAGKRVSSVLDVGCRTGDFLMHWPVEVRRVGVELSKNSAEIARARGLEIHQEYLEKAEFEMQFDLLTCYAVIEHLPDPVTFLTRAAGLVERDGILAIMVPTRECLKRRLLDSLGRRWHMDDPPLHLNFMSKELVDATLSKHGFKLVQRRYASGGMFNPFGYIPLIDRLGRVLMEYHDAYSPLNRLPIFDHLYSYFRKADSPLRRE